MHIDIYYAVNYKNNKFLMLNNKILCCPKPPANSPEKQNSRNSDNFSNSSSSLMISSGSDKNNEMPKIDPQKYCLNICASGKFNSDNNFSLKRRQNAKSLLSPSKQQEIPMQNYSKSIIFSPKITPQKTRSNSKRNFL